MSDTTQDQDAPDAKEIGQALLVAASSIPRKLISRLDARLERSAFLDYASGHEAADALARAARSVHPDLEPLARQLGRLLALGPDALSAGHLRMLAQAGFQRTAGRVSALAPQRAGMAAVSETVRKHPVAAVLAAVAGGYLLARAVR